MIQTTQGKATSAYAAIMAMRNKVKGTDALKLYKLKNRLKEHYDFQAEEELKLVTEYGGTIMDNGRVIVRDPDKRKDFAAAVQGLADMPCEVDADPVTVHVGQDSEITLADMEPLEGFVNFEEVDNGDK